MRTREEQIEAIYFMIDDDSHSECRRLVNEWLEEAERRVEQRVRAEIGRDSERLDWMEKLPLADIHRLGSRWEIGVNNISFSEGKQTLRETIDAAREVW